MKMSRTRIIYTYEPVKGPRESDCLELNGSTTPVQRGSIRQRPWCAANADLGTMPDPSTTNDQRPATNDQRPTTSDPGTPTP